MSLSQEQIRSRIEFILDRIAHAVIQNPSIQSETVNQNQRTIRNGIITIGRANSERLVLYSSDIEANPNDLLGLSSDGKTLEQIVIDIPDINQVTIDASDLNNISLSYPLGNNEVTTHYITDLLTETTTNEDGTTTIVNPQNVGQFVTLTARKTNVDILQAKEFLDTNIFELLPDGSIRQQDIDNLFISLNDLLPPLPTGNGFDNQERIDRTDNGEWVGSEQYYLDNSISAPQNDEEGSIEEEEGFITRLSKNVSDENQNGKSIEELRNRLNSYLKDIDESPIELGDERPEYQNQSPGYLKFRNLNQGIIVRNTNKEFVEGLNPETRDYLQTGFTITMWVRFLDKTSEGTLFNFGNPLREEGAFGFQLDTFVIDDEENKFIQDNVSSGYTATTGPDNPNGALFTDTDSERFVRLMVYDDDVEKIRDSHTANPHRSKLNVLPTIDDTNNQFNKLALFNNVKIPEDFNEWYFICATYNPNIDEDDSFNYEDNTNGSFNNPIKMHNFWMNNWNPTTYEPTFPEGANWPGGTFDVVSSEWKTLLTRTNISSLDMSTLPRLDNGFVNGLIDFDFVTTNAEYVPTSVEITSTLGVEDNAENKQGFRIGVGSQYLNGGTGLSPVGEVNQVRGLPTLPNQYMASGRTSHYFSDYFVQNPNEFPTYFEEFDINQDGNVDINDTIQWVNGGREDISNYIFDYLDKSSEEQERMMPHFTPAPADDNNSVSEYFGPYTFNRVQIARSGDAEVVNDGEPINITITNFKIRYEDELEIPGSHVVNSNLGNRCKVEIISRSDLLRARGYKV
mgnify:CR=1 FL=1